MKKLIPILFVAIIMSVPISAFSQCPGVYNVSPFITETSPAPYYQCAYQGKTRKITKVNHCKQIYKKLSTRFSQKLENWNCYYNPSNKKYQYFFTFKAPKKT